MTIAEGCLVGRRTRRPASGGGRHTVAAGLAGIQSTYRHPCASAPVRPTDHRVTNTDPSTAASQRSRRRGCGSLYSVASGLPHHLAKTENNSPRRATQSGGGDRWLRYGPVGAAQRAQSQRPASRETVRWAPAQALASERRHLRSSCGAGRSPFPLTRPFLLRVGALLLLSFLLPVEQHSPLVLPA